MRDEAKKIELFVVFNIEWSTIYVICKKRSVILKLHHMQIFLYKLRQSIS